jgi:hypothetical protein
LKKFLHPSKHQYPDDLVGEDNPLEDETFDPDSDQGKKKKKKSAPTDVDPGGYFDHGSYLKGKKFCMSGKFSSVKIKMVLIVKILK